MSEHRIVTFRAIDKPVKEKDLEYMRRQSSRAKVTPWSFDNTYDFGDFRGDALEMLRRGYDIHLHCANFGIRKLLIRLPNGLPHEKAAKAYFQEDSLRFLKDKQGKGRILCIQPFHKPGDLEELWEIGDLIDRLVPLRAEILDGDLRPLYLAHLAMAVDGNHFPDKTKEAPVPAGLAEPTDAQHALMELFGLSDALIAAAAKGIPARAALDDVRNQHATWLQGQSAATKDAWLAQLMFDPHATVRTEILAAFQKNRQTAAWPTYQRDRTIAELEAAAVAAQEEMDRKSAAKAARQKTKKLADMATNRAQTLAETEKLVKQRSRESYSQIAKMLADLREALASTGQSGLAEQQARKLKKENPTLAVLTSELRRKGLLAK